MAELVIALAVGGILMTIAVSAVAPVMSNLQVRSAQNGFVSIVGKARALAIEQGAETVFHVDFAGDSAWIEGVNESHDFRKRDGVDVQSTASSIEMIMTPRGFARGASTSVTVQFIKGNASSQVTLLPLGQVVF